MQTLNLNKACVRQPVHRSCAKLRRPTPFSGGRKFQLCRAVEGKEEVDLETQMEMFLKRQAELESGAAFAGVRNTDKVLGADVVPDDVAKQYCREIFELMKKLKDTRDMSVNELKLIVAIEDPRAREKRMQGIEDDRGVSRDEMAACVIEIAEGRIPKDRIALKCLYEDIVNWPFLDTTGTSYGASNPKPSEVSKAEPTSNDYASLMSGDTVVKPYIMSDELRKGEKPQSITDMLPGWVGYGALYGISAIPVFIVLTTIYVLWTNSLR